MLGAGLAGKKGRSRGSETGGFVAFDDLVKWEESAFGWGMEHKAVHSGV